MPKKYVVNGNWLLCSEGSCIQKVAVSSQSTVYAHSQLMATLNDRMGANFNCLKLMLMGATVGAIAGAAVIAGAVMTGGTLVAGAAAAIATATLAGGVAGKVASVVPCVCAMLTKPFVWTSVHEQVFIQKQMALMPDATLGCLLGGVVTIMLPPLQTAIDMAMLSDHVYDPKKCPLPEGWEMIGDKEMEELGLQSSMFENEKTGFVSGLYKNIDGEYALVFRGTVNAKDWQTNLQQGIGLEDKQYQEAIKLVKNLKKKMPEEKVTITGHSLGGGLASAGGAVTGFETYTFNTAGLHPNTLKREGLDLSHASHVQAYYSDHDPLNLVQNHKVLVGSALMKLGSVGAVLGSTMSIPSTLPQAAGKKIGIKTKDNIISGHSISGLKEALLAEKAGSPDLNVIAEHD